MRYVAFVRIALIDWPKKCSSFSFFFFFFDVLSPALRWFRFAGGCAESLLLSNCCLIMLLELDFFFHFFFFHRHSLFFGGCYFRKLSVLEPYTLLAGFFLCFPAAGFPLAGGLVWVVGNPMFSSLGLLFIFLFATLQLLAQF